MALLPILLILSRVVGKGVDKQTALSFYGMLELVIALLGIIAAVLFSYFTKSKGERLDQGEEYTN
jgi:hypothetical protein